MLWNTAALTLDLRFRNRRSIRLTSFMVGMFSGRSEYENSSPSNQRPLDLSQAIMASSLLAELVDAPQTISADILAGRIEGDTIEPAHRVDAVGFAGHNCPRMQRETVAPCSIDNCPALARKSPAAAS